MNSSPPELIAAEVEALLERNRIAQAKARLRGALQDYPSHPELLLQSAWADYMSGGNEDALHTVHQVLASDPENQSARQLLFELLAEKNNLVEAEQVILQLLHDYPEHAPYYGRYAELMIRAMQLEKARALASEGLKYDPGDAGCLAARAICDFCEQRPGTSSQALQQLLVRYPQSERTLLLVLAALEDRGHNRAALRIAQQLVQAQPDNGQFVQLAARLKAAAHWTMMPLWPMSRWSWGASIALWLLAIVSIRIVSRINPAAAVVLALCYLAYVIYSWVWPPLLRRWIARA
jgi:tetratricopeptide (TPR) repeat protein